MALIACIGSRELTEVQLNICQSLGVWIVRRGHELHSGNAPGADQAYARGGNEVNPALVNLHLPWFKFERHAIHPMNVVWNVDDEHDVPAEKLVMFESLARKHHPAWHRLSQGARKLMVRNSSIIKPPPEFDHVDLVLAWPSDKPGGGGTGQGMRIAQDLGIPLVDLRLLGRPQLAKLCEDIRNMPLKREGD